MPPRIKAIIFDIGGTLKVAHQWPWHVDTRPCLERMHGRYRLLVGANQPRILRDYLRVSGLDGYFDGVYLSEEMGLLKPDRRFFLRILEDQHVRPAEVAMIGDDLENDIAPAQALGLYTVWVKRDPGLALAEERGLVGRIVPDVAVAGLDELA